MYHGSKIWPRRIHRTPLFEWFSSCFAWFAALNSCFLQEGSVKLVKELHYILVRLYGRMVTDGILIYTDGHCRCFFGTTSNQLLAVSITFHLSFCRFFQGQRKTGLPRPQRITRTNKHLKLKDSPGLIAKSASSASRYQEHTLRNYNKI